MIGIWGSSGIGKTTIARVLFNRLSRHFQGSIYIDMRFIAKSKKTYSKSNPNDQNMKLHLQENFLCKLLAKQNIKVDHLGAVRGKLKNMKVLIFIDDLDDGVVLDALVGGDEWFGLGSRIILVAKDKQILRGQNSPPDGFMELASEVAARAGRLPIGLNLLGSSMRGRNKKYWVDLLPTLRKGLDGKIQKALQVSYDGLERKEHKALFRHIACLFNGDEVNNIKLMLADSGLNVDIGFEILVDKSLIHVIPSLDHTNFVEMHSLVEEMGKEVVRAQSDEPGEREFLIDPKDVCDVLEDNMGTKNILGISLDLYETDEMQIHKQAFEKMRNLRFLYIHSNQDLKKQFRLNLHEGFNYLPPTLRLLRWDGYPMRGMPSNFCPENLVELQMNGSKLEKLWEGTYSLTRLKKMELRGSTNLKEILDLSKATNLETFCLARCSSLVELPSFIQHLNKLKNLDMSYCEKLEILPTGVNLKSLEGLNVMGCTRLKSFPDISSNISNLDVSETAVEEFVPNLRLENIVQLRMCGMKSEKLWERVQPLTPLMAMISPSLTWLSLWDIPTLVELPSSFENLNNLELLSIRNCINLETLPDGINLKSLDFLDLSGCSRFRIFPDISTNISQIHLDETRIEEVPWWIEKFSNLTMIIMQRCKNLKHVSLNINKLNRLERVDFTDCGVLTVVSLNGSRAAMATDNLQGYIPNLLKFTNCFNLNQEALVETKTELPNLILPGDEVPSYFTHQTSGTSSSLTIPLAPSFLSQPFFRIRVCSVVIREAPYRSGVDGVDVHVNCRFRGRFGNIFESSGEQQSFWATGNESQLFIMDCCFPLNNDDAPPLAELNYDHVDIQLHISKNGLHYDVNYDYEDCTFRLVRWGVRLLEDYSSADNTLPRVCEADEDNMVNDESHATEQGEECGDSVVEIEERRKRMRESMKLIRFIIHTTARRSIRNEILKVLKRSLKRAQNAGSKD
ncbi:unnamed protein product [Microthlaspi erraticum]|uniref:NB-ARC domain-containing protein n=1 Tax=Microthlaspi erraticum TaxID=1685480 RepID=A0A6D2LEV7_9BRAS|nr:unnamed protein product [Microthlaspi erraticum]